MASRKRDLVPRCTPPRRQERSHPAPASVSLPRLWTETFLVLAAFVLIALMLGVSGMLLQ